MVDLIAQAVYLVKRFNSTGVRVVNVHKNPSYRNMKLNLFFFFRTHQAVDSAAVKIIRKLIDVLPEGPAVHFHTLHFIRHAQRGILLFSKTHEA